MQHDLRVARRVPPRGLLRAGRALGAPQLATFNEGGLLAALAFAGHLRASQPEIQDELTQAFFLFLGHPQEFQPQTCLLRRACSEVACNL